MVEIQLSMRVRLSMFSVSCATFITSTRLVKQITIFTGEPVPKIILPGKGGGLGEEVTPLYGLHGDVPLDKVWFLSSLSQTGYTISCESVLNRCKISCVYFTSCIISCESVLITNRVLSAARLIWFAWWNLFVLQCTKSLTIKWICSIAIANKWL